MEFTILVFRVNVQKGLRTVMGASGVSFFTSDWRRGREQKWNSLQQEI